MFIFLDEEDFFRPSDEQDSRDVPERYIANSNSWIVVVSSLMLWKVYSRG
jgi:hypothetical protein